MLIQKRMKFFATAIVFGLITCVSLVWSSATERDAEFEKNRHEYCIFNQCNPYEDCYMYQFCRFVLLHQAHLDDKEFGTTTDYSKFKDATVPLFNSKVRLIPSNLADVLAVNWEEKFTIQKIFQKFDWVLIDLFLSSQYSTHVPRKARREKEIGWCIYK